jgi:hypothetical protein
MGSGSRAVRAGIDVGVVGVVDRIGADHIHGNVHRAVEAQLAGLDVITDDIRGARAARVVLANARGGGGGRSDRRAARSLWFSALFTAGSAARRSVCAPRVGRKGDDRACCLRSTA